MTAIQTSHLIFEESLVSLMSRTIRAVTNRFIRRGIELDLRIVPDIANKIMNKTGGTVSILVTRFEARINERERDRVYATMFIHKDANRNLARACIAEGIYCLLFELDAYIKEGRKHWPDAPGSKQFKIECSLFAWELCRLHDNFYRNEAAQQKYMRFPVDLFAKPPDKASSKFEWPNGFALDPKNPFYAVPDLDG